MRTVLDTDRITSSQYDPLLQEQSSFAILTLVTLDRVSNLLVEELD
ncbi:MAG: hypothetical protein ACFFD4_26995 [Candidatus Odinarchaeota archaeon]